MNLIPRLVMPLNWLPPAPWRTRFFEINYDFDHGGPLKREFEAVATVEMERGDLAAEEEIQLLVDRHPNLFPGEAGFDLAWSILCGSPLRLARRFDREIRNPFEDPVAAYTATCSTGGKNKFSARERNAELVRKVLDLLRGNEQRPPMNHREVTERLGLTSRELHSLLGRVKRQLNVRLRDQRLESNLSEQAYVAEIRVWAASLARREREPVKDLCPVDGEPTINLSSNEAEQATGIPSDELIARGVESYSSMRIDAASESRQMLKVPRRLLASATTLD